MREARPDTGSICCGSETRGGRTTGIYIQRETSTNKHARHHPAAMPRGPRGSRDRAACHQSERGRSARRHYARGAATSASLRSLRPPVTPRALEGTSEAGFGCLTARQPALEPPNPSTVLTVAREVPVGARGRANSPSAAADRRSAVAAVAPLMPREAAAAASAEPGGGASACVCN